MALYFRQKAQVGFSLISRCHFLISPQYCHSLFSLHNYINLLEGIGEGNEKPICPSNVEGSVANLMDHLNGYIYRHNLTAYRPERGLKNAFESLGGSGIKESVEQMANRIARLMKNPDSKVLSYPENHLHSVDKSPVSWVYATLAALYWRVEGNASMAVDCLRYALAYAPANMRVSRVFVRIKKTRL